MAGDDSNKRVLSNWLKQESKRFKRGIIIVVALSLMGIGARLFSLFFIAVIIHNWVIDQQAASATILVGLSLSILFAYFLVSIRDYQQSKLARLVGDYFHNELQNKLSERSLALVRHYEISQWFSFFTRRVTALQNYYSGYVPQVYLAILTPVIIFTITFYISWLVGIILLVTAPLIPLFMWLVGLGVVSAHRENFIAIERLGGFFLDRLRAQNLLKAFNQVDAERAVFVDASSQLKNRTLKVVSLAFLSSSVLDFFSTVSMALVAVLVGFTLLGEIEIGYWGDGLSLQDGLFLLMIAPVFFNELKTLGRLYHDKAEALGAAEEIHTIVNLAPLQIGSSNVPFSLEASKVYTADQEKIILTFPSLTIGQGDKILLSGPSGSGKTSLLEALLGLRPIESQGQTTCIDRSSVVWLNQKPPFLPLSVRENLLLDAKHEDSVIFHVIEKVGLTGWLAEQVHGLDTLFSDHPPLSGGQKQRFAVAQLLLQSAEIVFLDEPTAHLCSDQRELITQLLMQELADKTVIWISHSLGANDFFTQYWSIASDGKLHA